jgi:hypothetical protein
MENNQRPDFNSNWERWRENIRREYPDMSDEDLSYEASREEELLERLQIKTGKTKAQIFEWLHLMG